MMRHASNFDLVGFNGGVGRGHCIDSSILTYLFHLIPSLNLDEFMLFDTHINHISRKINGILLFLSKIKDSFEQTSLIIVVQSLALSIINYCLKVWGMETQQQIDGLQQLKNFAAKTAFGRVRKCDSIYSYLYG